MFHLLRDLSFVGDRHPWTALVRSDGCDQVVCLQITWSVWLNCFRFQLFFGY